MLSIIFAVLGIIIGSFLNVVIARYNTGLSIGGRSKCFSCSKTLTPLELIPIFSFLCLKAKCKSCGSKISAQYILVEIITGFLFFAIIYKFGLNLASVLYLILASLLVVISVYDLKHKIIPDLAVFCFIVISLFSNLLTYGYDFFGFNFLIGPILFAFFALVWLVSGGKWMGFGDAKLVLGIGFLLGLTDSILAMLIAFWVGAIVGIIVLALSRPSITIKYEIPFAPFLVLGTLVALLTSFNVLYKLAIVL